MEDKMVTKGHIICLSETWLLSNENSKNIEIDGYELQVNSVGRGKGIVTYFKQNMFEHYGDVKDEYFQLTKITSESLDVISVYRSQEGQIKKILNELSNLINWDKNTLICGDFNVCYNSNRSHKLITTLESFGFRQLVQEATHIKGGWIDHVYIRETETKLSVGCSLYSPYYCALDHDALLTTIKLVEK